MHHNLGWTGTNLARDSGRGRKARSDFRVRAKDALHCFPSPDLQVQIDLSRKRERLAHKSNRIPCASGSAFEQLIVAVWQRMEARHAWEPDSRPPPVSFSPPKAPPISAPDGPMFTFAMPQSEPAAATKRSASRISLVNT